MQWRFTIGGFGGLSYLHLLFYLPLRIENITFAQPFPASELISSRHLIKIVTERAHLSLLRSWDLFLALF